MSFISPLRRIVSAATLAAVLTLPAACAMSKGGTETVGATDIAPVMRWDHRPEATVWTEATLQALHTDGAALLATVPADIAAYCPGYETASADERAAFWAGFLSALAKHESTWNPQASGGGGKWLGLLQIAPATASAYGCTADDATALREGTGNLQCGVRIAAHQVGRDGAIASSGGRWAGVARDWAPMRSDAKRADIAAWTREQNYCKA